VGVSTWIFKFLILLLSILTHYFEIQQLLVSIFKSMFGSMYTLHTSHS
jgi:hypothetical protein